MTSTTFFFVFIPLLAVILLAINLIFAPHNPYQEKDNVFECGFHSFLGQNRTQFSISFFIFALLFLLFDLEILLVYPYVVSAHTNGIYGLAIMLIFFLALTLGFAFELGKNALKIDSRQMVKLIHNRFNSTTHLSSVLGGLAFLKATPRYFSTCRSLALPLPSSAEVNSDNTSLPTSSEVNDSENLPLFTSAEVNDSENLPLPTSAEEDERENLPLPTSAEEDERDNSPSSSEPEENNGNNSPPNSESESLNGSGSSGESGYGSDPDGEYYDEGADAMVYAPVENIPERNIREYITATKDISQHPIEVDNHRDDSDSAEGRQVYYDRHFELKAELRLRKTQGVVVDSDSDDDGSCATCHTPLHAGPDVPSNKPRGEVANTEVANTEVANTEVANTEVANTEVANTDVANTEVANTEVANTDVANTDAIIGTPAVDTLALRNKSEADDQSSAQSNSTSNKRKFEADEDSSSQRRPGYQDSSDITADTEPMSYGWDAED